MLFNSLDFAIFLPIVFVLYWFVFVNKLQVQNALIVIASYVFYGWWDWRFLSLIIFSTVVDFSIGKQLKGTQKASTRTFLLWSSIVVNLGLLGVFKYYNFFLDNFITAFSLLGFSFRASSLQIILPVGISFYTFQTLSYTIDVYKRKIEPTENFIAFAAFVSFFPQLVAGPIERAKKLLPQFYHKRTFEFDNAIDGSKQILWGLFKKVVIADSCAETVNIIFADPSTFSASTLLLGAVLFSFQIYGDFSGYSDIAIGTARLFGFDLMKNFAFPYFSRDIAEFWRRWHISLSTWFRDYLYIPLGGSRGGNYMRIRNTFIIFLVSGFWHGANWTFIIWGLLNALYFLPLLLSNRNRNHLDIVATGKRLPSAKEAISIITTYALTVLAWIFFRSDSVSDACIYISHLFNISMFSVPSILPITTLFMLVIFLFLEWIGREGEYGLERIGHKWKSPQRFALYYLIGVTVLLFSGQKQSFIYFQF